MTRCMCAHAFACANPVFLVFLLSMYTYIILYIIIIIIYIVKKISQISGVYCNLHCIQHFESS